MKYIWLIRHAKTAESPPPGGGDFERDLNRRGHRDGATMQAWFAELSNSKPELRPDWLVTSSAVRAVSTSQFVAQGFSLAPDQQHSDAALYLAAPEVLLDALRSTPEHVSCTALVAHNPGMTWLINSLSADSEMIENLPTFGCALFQADVSDWAAISATTRVLLITPRALEPST